MSFTPAAQFGGGGLPAWLLHGLPVLGPKQTQANLARPAPAPTAAVPVTRRHQHPLDESIYVFEEKGAQAPFVRDNWAPCNMGDVQNKVLAKQHQHVTEPAAPVYNHKTDNMSVTSLSVSHLPAAPQAQPPELQLPHSTTFVHSKQDCSEYLTDELDSDLTYQNSAIPRHYLSNVPKQKVVPVLQYPTNHNQQPANQRHSSSINRSFSPSLQPINEQDDGSIYAADILNEAGSFVSSQTKNMTSCIHPVKPPANQHPQLVTPQHEWRQHQPPVPQCQAPAICVDDESEYVSAVLRWPDVSQMQLQPAKRVTQRRLYPIDENAPSEYEDDDLREHDCQMTDLRVHSLGHNPVIRELHTQNKCDGWRWRTVNWAGEQSHALVQAYHGRLQSISGTWIDPQTCSEVHNSTRAPSAKRSHRMKRRRENQGHAAGPDTMQPACATPSVGYVICHDE